MVSDSTFDVRERRDRRGEGRQDRVARVRLGRGEHLGHLSFSRPRRPRRSRSLPHAARASWKDAASSSRSAASSIFSASESGKPLIVSSMSCASSLLYECGAMLSSSSLSHQMLSSSLVHSEGIVSSTCASYAPSAFRLVVRASVACLAAMM